MPLKISIIIPSYNQGKYIEETICSVLDQYDPNLELIIIDGASTDNSVEIIKKYQRSLAFWVAEPDKGQSDAINKGFAKATGDIITWLGSDDLLEPDSLAQIRTAFESGPAELGVVHGYADMFRNGTSLRIDKGFRIQNKERRLAGMAFPQPSAFMRKKYVDQVGSINPDLHYGMDYDLFARLAMVCEFKKLEICLSRYRLHPESKSGGDLENFKKEWVLIFNSIISGLEIDKLKYGMQELDLIVSPLAATENYFRKFKGNHGVDLEKLFFFFFCNVFRLTYLSGRFARAARIGKFLTKYHADKLSMLPDIHHIVKRSVTYPAFVLSWARKLRSSQR